MDFYDGEIFKTDFQHIQHKRGKETKITLTARVCRKHRRIKQLIEMGSRVEARGGKMVRKDIAGKKHHWGSLPNKRYMLPVK